MLLSIDKRKIEPGITVLVLTGKIALGRESQKIDQQVNELIQAGETKIILDLSGVDYIDSTGVGLITLCAGKTGAAGGKLCVAGAKGLPQNILRLTKVDTIVGSYSSADEAVAGF
jgi:anti-sigma B factor antagonist